MTSTSTPLAPAFQPEGLPVGDGWLRTDKVAPVLFPLDGSIVAEAPEASIADAQRALEAGAKAVATMAALPSHRRAGILHAAYEALVAQADALAELITLETGKPLVDSRTEVERAQLTLRLSGEEATRIHGETVPLDLLPAGEGMLGFWRRRPVGLVLGITGFNYPLLLSAHKAGPALAAGCPVILKPAPKTPLSVIHLARILREAGAPAESVQVVTGDAEVGDTLVRDERVAAVSFTGSAKVGHAIARAAAPRKVVLELGSNAALIVAADADLERAAAACARGGFYASGQACISVQRVIVEEAVAAAFLEKLVPMVQALKVGDPRSADTRVGPLVDENAAIRVSDWIQQAVQGGALLLCGGARDRAVVDPAVLVDVPDGLPAWDEEIFGPVIAVRRVASLDAAIDVANHTEYGLHVSVFTRDLQQALRAADRVQAGGVLINEIPGFRADNMPYGGVKRSGIGREGPRFAIEELTVTQMVMLRP